MKIGTKLPFTFFWVLKTFFLPSKSGFLVFEEKPCKKLFDPQNSAFLSFETTTLKKLFFILSYCFSYKNYSWTNVVLVIIFENALKMAKMAFLMNNICCAFSKIPPKRKFVRLWFLLLNQSWNMKKKISLRVFLQKPKTLFFKGKKSFLKLRFHIFLHLFFNVKGSFMPWTSKIQGLEFSHLLKIAPFNERLWAICSDRFAQMSNCEQIAQVAHQKWANEQIAHFLSESLIR